MEEEVEDFHISRGIGSILAAKGKGKKKGKHQAKLAARLAEAGQSPKPRHEVQGPVSWASDHLRVKYRCEDRRLEAYESYLRAVEEAKVLEREDGVIMAVASVERHPITQLYEELMALEISRASTRARARNQMRRFVLDVHTVWITNLSGLDEHKGLDESEEGHRSKSKNNPGIPNRRDSEAILNVSSQIQSVAVARSFEDAGLLMDDLEADGNQRREEVRGCEEANDDTEERSDELAAVSNPILNSRFTRCSSKNEGRNTRMCRRVRRPHPDWQNL